MSRFIRSETNPRRNAHHDEIRAMLGLGMVPMPKLPTEGVEPHIIQGIKVWVTPLMGPRVPRCTSRYQRPLEGKSSTHRVLAECPDCGRVLSVGRLHQHVCKTCAVCGDDAVHTDERGIRVCAACDLAGQSVGHLVPSQDGV